MAVYDKTGSLIADLNADMYLPVGEAVADNNKKYASSDFMRIVFLDNNYKYFSVANIKLIIDQMHTSGLNYLMLGFGGSGRGLCFKLNDMVISANGTTYDIEDCLSTNYNKYLSESDMAEIITYANTNGIEIIPMLTMPGHFTPFLVDQSQFRYQNDPASLDVDNEQAVNYGLAIAEMYMKWFAGHGVKYWHYGADEFGSDINNGYYAMYSNGNFNYAKFINNVAYLASSYRMIPMSWNDPYCLDGDSIPLMNRAVKMCYWAKHTTHWASSARLETEGYELLNSSESIYWVANGTQVTQAQMQNFNIHAFRDGTTIAEPVGSCFCIWIGNRESPSLDDDGSAITQAVLPLIATYGTTIASQIN